MATDAYFFPNGTEVTYASGAVSDIRLHSGTIVPSALVLLNFDPVAPATLTPSQTIKFDLQIPPPAVLDRFIIFVQYPDLANKTEVVFIDSAFTPDFSGASSFTDIVDGGNIVTKQFRILRNGGWIGSPKMFVDGSTTFGGRNV